MIFAVSWGRAGAAAALFFAPPFSGAEFHRFYGPHFAGGRARLRVAAGGALVRENIRVVMVVPVKPVVGPSDKERVRGNAGGEARGRRDRARPGCGERTFAP